MAMSEPAPDLMTLIPAFPDPITVDWKHAWIVYDRVSDQLLVYFGGVAREAVSIAIDTGDRDYFFARVDPNTGETVGLQIDGLLVYGIVQNPDLVAFLALAELRGYDDMAAANLHRWAQERVNEEIEAEISAAVGRLIA